MKPTNKGIRFVWGISALFAMYGCRDFGTAPTTPRVPEMKGFSYTSFTSNGFTLGSQSNAIGDLQTQINNSWISLVVFEYQSTRTSYDIGPNTTGVNPVTGGPWSTSSTESDLREGIRQARLHGMKIMLKPHLDLYSGEWRALIQPDPTGNWFRAYTAMIVRYARLASELNVELLCIGTEFVVATQPMHTTSWRSVIDSVRSHFSGSLTYAANWSGAFNAGITQPEYEQIQFWDRLEYIGVDAYYPLTSSANEPIPSFETGVGRMRTAQRSIGDVVSRWRKPAIITEVGIQSVRGALASPWEFSLGRAQNAVQDNAAQELYYRVVIEALGGQSWCVGIFWWNWDSVPSLYEPTDYTPRNKPATLKVRQWYSGVGV